VLLRGLEIDCGCFDPGGGQDVTAGIALLRDVGLMILVVLAWWLRASERDTNSKLRIENSKLPL
jgi:hypothetical protein